MRFRINYDCVIEGERLCCEKCSRAFYDGDVVAIVHLGSNRSDLCHACIQEFNLKMNETLNNYDNIRKEKLDAIAQHEAEKLRKKQEYKDYQEQKKIYCDIIKAAMKTQDFKVSNISIRTSKYSGNMFYVARKNGHDRVWLTFGKEGNVDYQGLTEYPWMMGKLSVTDPDFLDQLGKVFKESFAGVAGVFKKSGN